MDENIKKLAEIKTFLIDDLNHRVTAGSLDIIKVLSEAIYRITMTEKIERENLREVSECKERIKHLKENEYLIPRDLLEKLRDSSLNALEMNCGTRAKRGDSLLDEK